tara:strand:- start:11676 stop:11864 length:189 start_codon:yes stop_codon:yes gene_type:complete
MAIKKYVLRVYYDSTKGEIVHLSEQFSDEDEYKLIVDDEELDIPSEMQDFLNVINSDDIGVS